MNQVDELNTMLDQTINNQFELKKNDAEVMSEMITAEEIDNPDELNRIFSQYTRLHKEVTEIYVGTPEGAFFLISQCLTCR